MRAWPSSKTSRASRGVTKLTNDRIDYLVRESRRFPRHESIGQMAARWGVTRRRLYQVLQLSRAMGGTPLLKTNRRPRAPPLTEEEKQLLRTEWETYPRGASLLYKALRHRGTVIPKMKIYRYAQSQGWVDPNPNKKRRRKWVRYERAHSGSLLHGDFHQTSFEHPHCLLWEDDASRMLLSGGEFATETAEAAITTLRAALARAEEWNLRVDQVLTDRGVQFFTSPKGATQVVPARQGEGQFQRFLREQGIGHVVARVNHPQTNGKLERLWREYDRHRWRYATLEEWIEGYNHAIHGALWDMECPAEAFQRKLPVEALLGLHGRQVERLEKARASS
jgi:putative transposase